jgi:hypothetical protein
MKRLGIFLSGTLLAFVFSTTAYGGVILRFDQDRYSVLAGETFDVDIILDADDQIPGDQVLTEGLFSMAYEVLYDGDFSEIESDDQIVLPDLFETDGVSGGPPFVRSLDPTAKAQFVQVFTAVTDPFTDGFYHGADRGQGQQMWLGTISITATAPGTFGLNVQVFKRNASDQVFVDESFTVLDDQIVTGSATVDVIPEPTTLMISVAGLGVCVGLRRRTCSTQPAC